MHEQVLFDILLYLPVMSLLRFKSVCKSWFFLIESSTFITQHLNYNRDKEDNLFIINYWDHNLRRNVMQSLLHFGSQYEDCVYIDFDRLLWHPTSDEIMLAGSCNGIICLKHEKSMDVALWNPSLKQLRPLPQPSFSESEYSYGYIGFGIDVKTNDYKVLKIFIIPSEECKVIGNQVEVYSLRDNSWRIIHESNVLPFLSAEYIVNGKYVMSTCLNGKCFWICHDKLSSNLISFDFTDEVFGTMSLPPDGEDGPHDPRCLDIYNDKIIYIRLMRDYIKHYISGYKLEIWMLCEYGIKESWNKIYTTGSFSSLYMISPLGLSRNGEFLICTMSDRGFEQKLFLYNLHTQEGKFLQSSPHQVTHYNASLISVKSANGI